MNYHKHLFFTLALWSGVMLIPTPAQAESHEYITYQRASTTTYVYFQEAVEGEYGQYSLHQKTGDDRVHSWQGSNLGTSAGVELHHFVQMEIGYAAVNMHNGSDKLERLSGSRLHAGLRLDFNSPLFNLEIGGGAQGSNVDYVNHEETASFAGSGYYGTLGLDHFLTTHFSVFAEVKVANEHLTNTGGANTISGIDSASRAGSLGFRIWF